MKKTILLAFTLLTALVSVAAGQLELKDITSGAFRGASMSALTPLADGESFARLSDDGKYLYGKLDKTDFKLTRTK